MAAPYPRADGGNQGRPVAAVRGGIFIDCSGDGDLAVWAGAPYEIGDDAGGMLYPSMMFRLNGIDPVPGRRGSAHDPGADGGAPRPPVPIHSRANQRSCGRRSRRSNGG